MYMAEIPILVIIKPVMKNNNTTILAHPDW
jgi:hypothetical protein